MRRCLFDVLPEAWSPDHLIYWEFLPAGSFFDYHDSDTDTVFECLNQQTDRKTTPNASDLCNRWYVSPPSIGAVFPLNMLQHFDRRTKRFLYIFAHFLNVVDH